MADVTALDVHDVTNDENCIVNRFLDGAYWGLLSYWYGIRAGMKSAGCTEMV